jgi:hypothetical protein
MIARNRIWEELKQAKTNIICLQRYTDRGRRRLRWFNMAVIIIPMFGSLAGGILNSILIAITGASLTALVAAIKAILPNLIQSDQELSELDRLMDFYSKYMNKLEQIWYQYNTKIITEPEMIKLLFAAKEEETDKYSLLNKGIRSISKSEQEKINNISIEYIDRVYFTKLETNERT